MEGLCLTCGLPGSYTCQKCKDTTYCSRECQVFGWKKANHKIVCKGSAQDRKLHKVVIELFRTELAFFKTMTVQQKGILAFLNGYSTGTAPFDMPITDPREVADIPLNHFSQAGRIALCLVGVIPCAVVSHIEWEALFGLSYGALYHEKVTKAWYQRNEMFLSERGFVVEVVEGNIYPQGEPGLCHCGCGRLASNNIPMFGSRLLVKDTNNPMIDKVNMSFGRHDDDGGRRRKVSDQDVSLCTTSWAPTGGGPHHYGEEGVSCTYYLTQQPKVVFGDPDLCCSPAYKHMGLVHQDDATTLGKHFCECHSQLLNLGLHIGFALSDHVSSSRPWPDEAFANAWLAAAGNDFDLVFNWIDKRGVFNFDEMDNDRIERIRSILLERM